MRDEGGDRFFRQPRHRPGHAHRRDHAAAVVADRRGDAGHTELALLVLDRAAALARGAERLGEFLRAGDGLRRARLEAGGDDAVDNIVRLKGEDCLPLGGAMSRLAHADVRAHADRVRSLEIVDVHDLGAVEDREMHALVDLGPQLVEVGARLVGDVHAPAHQRPEPEQRDAELVFAALAVLLQEPLRDQRHGQPMDRALGETEPARQRADPDLDLVLGERLEQSDGGRHRRQAPAPSLRLALAGCLLPRHRNERQDLGTTAGRSAPRTVVPKHLGAGYPDVSIIAPTPESGTGSRRMNAARKIVVVGGGPAGVAAALAARQQDPAAEVVLLNDEQHEPYEKPPLSKAVLTGKVTPADAPIAGPKGVAGAGVTLRSGMRVAAIDRGARAVVTEAGERIPYDALVLATGSVNRALPLFPMRRKGIYYLRTEAEARALKAHLHRSRSLLVIGGGLIGLEVAASAAELGVKTTVIEVAPRILARVCDAELSALIHEHHATRGVDLLVDTAPRELRELADGRLAVETQHGTITTDLIVVGAGVMPDDRLAREAGLPAQDGIMVDRHARTSDPAIFAAATARAFPDRTDRCGWRTGVMPRSMARLPAVTPPAAMPLMPLMPPCPRFGRSSMTCTSRA